MKRGCRTAWMVAVASALFGCRSAETQTPKPATLDPALERAIHTPVGPVEAEMRNVLYHVDDRVVLEIGHLRGVLTPTKPTAPPWFDDPASFVLGIDTADIAITPVSLSALLNDYVFNYKGTPLKHLEISIEEGELKQKGVLHKGLDLPFTIRAQLTVTEDGRLRLHPTKVKVLGIPMKSLMRLFGLELDNLVHVREGRGVEIVDNDFFLAPADLLPPPRIRGKLTAVVLERTRIRQIFGGSDRKGAATALRPSNPKARNYMFYRGKMLRFGKLTMADADLQIVDKDPSDPFDFYLTHLNEQLDAGESHNQPDFGLVTSMPDYNDLDRPDRRTNRKELAADAAPATPRR